MRAYVELELDTLIRRYAEFWAKDVGAEVAVPQQMPIYLFWPWFVIRVALCADRLNSPRRPRINDGFIEQFFCVPQVCLCLRRGGPWVSPVVTGIEANDNGVQLFRSPLAQRARGLLLTILGLPSRIEGAALR
jgi:hypothetical protein